MKRAGERGKEISCSFVREGSKCWYMRERGVGSCFQLTAVERERGGEGEVPIVHARERRVTAVFAHTGMQGKRGISFVQEENREAGKRGGRKQGEGKGRIVGRGGDVEGEGGW